MKFLTKEDSLKPESLERVKNDYKELAKQIDVFQKNKFKEWSDRIIDKALSHLKSNILKKIGENQYEVNFSD